MGTLSNTKPKPDDTKAKNKKQEPAGKTKQVRLAMPFQGMYENGVMKVDEELYSKVYSVAEMSVDETQEAEHRKLAKYMEFITSLGQEVHVQMIVFNDNVNRSEFEEEVLLELRPDRLNEYREEMNDMLVGKMALAKNNLVRKKYLVVSVTAKDVEAANVVFTRIDEEIAENGKRVTGTESVPLSIGDRLELMHRIYNIGKEVPFSSKMKYGTQESFSLRLAKKQNMSISDLIGPDSFEFGYDYFKVGDVYGRSMFLCNMPTYLRSDIMTQFCNMPFNMVASVHYKPVPQDKALDLLKEKTLNFKTDEYGDKEELGAYRFDNMPLAQKNAIKEVENIVLNMTAHRQELFMTTVVFTIFASSKLRLDEYTNMMHAEAERFVCQIKTLLTQQEEGLNTSLPVGHTYLKAERLLNTEAAMSFLAFGIKEQTRPHGIYYGLNKISRSILLYDRMSETNGNGYILGTTGSGKSFAAKREMVEVMLTTEDDVFVIDPEGEYIDLAQAMRGSVIDLEATGEMHLNPMDMDLYYAGAEDPVILKSAFIRSILETITNSKHGLTPVQETIIDRCVSNLFEEYTTALEDTDKTYDADVMPTLTDLYNELKAQPESEVNDIMTALEAYVQEEKTCFSFKTNVDVDSRFTVFNISGLHNNMKTFAMQVCLNNIWNRIIMNHRRGRRTWLYCDEFHLLVKTEESAKFVRQIWRSAGQWGAALTGVTSRAEDVFEQEEGRNAITDAQFLVILNLDTHGRMQLQNMFNASNTELEYVTSAQAGQGLIYKNGNMIPFVDEFPQDTKLFQIMEKKKWVRE